ncbi:WW domain binding protein 11-domain-containing protein [Phlebopus sp. FC_14]|nr:WW domain binding protein 11-domain-containing protein [Phlebopus sp. FC_14]
MAKGKNLNPADAYRKAQRKKELKKNRAERSKARDFALVKKDTRDIEDEIETLEAISEPSASQKSRLTDLKAELAKVMQKKEEYVKEHPEQRKLVYRARREEKPGDQNEAPPAEQKRKLFDKHGLPRHPERSIYYDPVMNPYGVPPPGMPYLERPLGADEVPSDEDAEGSDDDIVMPDGLPPGTSMQDAESDSDDEIPMPEGPPPALQRMYLSLFVVHDAEWATSDGSVPPPPFAVVRTPPPLPPNFIPPPPEFMGDTSLIGFGMLPLNIRPSSTLLQPIPPPPPGFFPRAQSTSSMQDPLSSIPHQTYQAHHAGRLAPPHPSLPPKPTSLAGFLGSTTASSVQAASATISAEPELRDLKKEATAFVPASLKRKKAPASSVASKVNAAPCVSAESDPPGPTPQTRPDLVNTLRDQLGAPPPPADNGPVQRKTPSVRGKDDYQRFVDEMSDLLGSTP